MDGIVKDKELQAALKAVSDRIPELSNELLKHSVQTKINSAQLEKQSKYSNYIIGLAC